MALAMMYILEPAACGRLDFVAHDGALDGADSVADAADATGDAKPVCDTTAPFATVTELTTLDNTAFGQGGLRLSPDERTAYFHSNRGGAYEIYTATRTTIDDTFSTPASTGIAGFYATVAPNGLTMLYRNNGDLYISTRNSVQDSFVAGTLFTPTMTAQLDTEPFVDAAGTLLYFTRDVTSQGREVFVADFPAGTLVRQLTELSTTSLEMVPAPSADGLTLYFARSTTVAPDEIWVAHRATTSAPFDPPALVPSANSPAFDGPNWLSEDNCRLYLESRRSGGDFRLFVAERTP